MVRDYPLRNGTLKCRGPSWDRKKGCSTALPAVHGFRPGSISSVGLAYAGLLACGTLFLAMVFRHSDQAISQSGDLQSGTAAEEPVSLEAESLYPVLVNRPDGPPMLDSGTADSAGLPILVQCSTCHATRQPNYENRSSSHLREFHRDVKVTHGTASCLSCHNPEDYQSLRLADGTRVEFGDVMQLCGQCHGPQLRDYERGIHGGMNGHWDLRRGPQFKNNCVDCHSPHHPKFPQMKTEFKPRDRFLPAEGHKSGGKKS